jgi:hypothetical protein
VLEERRPLLLIHTYKDGRKIYGRWTDEYDRVFIPALQPNKKAREEFLATWHASFGWRVLLG